MKYPTSPTPSEGSGSFPRSTSPLPAPANYQLNCLTASSKRYKYLRRIIKFEQMDFEYGLWQMVYLFIAPQKVYRNFQYRKQTKSQFARDDPAFLVLLSIWLCLSSIGFAYVLGLGFIQYIFFLLYVIFVDFIGAAIIVATFFDFLSSGGYLSCTVGNFFWLMGLFYYIYITFLGYSCLPILQNTRLLLLPLPLMLITYFVTLTLGWNISLALTNFYKYRVV